MAYLNCRDCRRQDGYAIPLNNTRSISLYRPPVIEILHISSRLNLISRNVYGLRPNKFASPPVLILIYIFLLLLLFCSLTSRTPMCCRLHSFGPFPFGPRPNLIDCTNIQQRRFCESTLAIYWNEPTRWGKGGEGKGREGRGGGGNPRQCYFTIMCI